MKKDVTLLPYLINHRKISLILGTILISAILFLTPCLLKAQIPNAGFEQLNPDNSISNWGNVYLGIISFDSLTQTYISDSVVYDNYYFTPSTDAHSGSVAMELRNAYDYTLNFGIPGGVSPDTNDFFSSWGSITSLPIQFAPTSLNFYYKYFPVNGDSANITLSIADANGYEVGNAEIILSGTTSNYSLANVPVNYISADPPAYYSLHFSNFYTADPYLRSPSFGTRLLIDDVSFDNATGIQNNQVNKNVSVYPNPATDKFAVITSEKLTNVILKDITGKKLQTFNSGFENIDVSNLSKGTYLIEIKTIDSFSIQKLIIE